MSFPPSTYHFHLCEQCRIERVTCYRINCQAQISDILCMICRADDEHLWISDLTLMAKMIASEIKLPHSIGACYDCGKARLLQINYNREKEALNMKDRDDLKIIILGSVGRMKERR